MNLSNIGNVMVMHLKWQLMSLASMNSYKHIKLTVNDFPPFEFVSLTFLLLAEFLRFTNFRPQKFHFKFKYFMHIGTSLDNNNNNKKTCAEHDEWKRRATILIQAHGSLNCNRLYKEPDCLILIAHITTH